MTTREDLNKFINEQDDSEMFSSAYTRAWQACAAHYETEIAELRKENRELILAGIDHMRHGIALLGKHHQAEEMAELKEYLETTCSSIEAELSNIRDERNALLALIAEKDKALRMIESSEKGETLADALVVSQQALSLTHDSVKLVEIGYVVYSPLAGFVVRFKLESNVSEKDKLYTIVKGE